MTTTHRIGTIHAPHVAALQTEGDTLGTRTTRTTRSDGSSRTRRFDHDAAFAHWVGLGATRTLRAVARQFSVSDTAMSKVAKQGNWPARLAKIEQEAADRSDRAAVKSFEERQRDQLRVTQKLRDRVLDAPVADIDVDAAVRSLPRYATIERLIAGEATSRVAITDLQPVMDAFSQQLLELAQLARQVDPDAVDRCLGRLDDELARLAAAAAVAPETVAA